jgi:uncharacterized membrane-anchored protein
MKERIGPVTALRLKPKLTAIRPGVRAAGISLLTAAYLAIPAYASDLQSADFFVKTKNLGTQIASGLQILLATAVVGTLVYFVIRYLMASEQMDKNKWVGFIKGNLMAFPFALVIEGIVQFLKTYYGS